MTARTIINTRQTILGGLFAVATVANDKSTLLRFFLREEEMEFYRDRCKLSNAKRILRGKMKKNPTLHECISQIAEECCEGRTNDIRIGWGWEVLI